MWENLLSYLNKRERLDPDSPLIAQYQKQWLELGFPVQNQPLQAVSAEALTPVYPFKFSSGHVTAEQQQIICDHYDEFLYQANEWATVSIQHTDYQGYISTETPSFLIISTNYPIFTDFVEQLKETEFDLQSVLKSLIYDYFQTEENRSQDSLFAKQFAVDYIIEIKDHLTDLGYTLDHDITFLEVLALLHAQDQYQANKKVLIEVDDSTTNGYFLPNNNEIYGLTTFDKYKHILKFTGLNLSGALLAYLNICEPAVPFSTKAFLSFMQLYLSARSLLQFQFTEDTDKLRKATFKHEIAHRLSTTEAVNPNNETIRKTGFIRYKVKQ